MKLFKLLKLAVAGLGSLVGLNACSANISEPAAGLYGPPPSYTDKAKRCRAELGGDSSDTCVEEYKAVGSSNTNISDPDADVYGPPPFEEEPYDEAMEE